MSIYTFYFAGLNHPNFAVQTNSGNYIVSDYGNNRIIEIDPVASSIVKTYAISGTVFFDYSEENETLLITVQSLNQISEITWSDMDLGSVIWTSSASFNAPQCATYKQRNANQIVIADTGNNRIVKYNKQTGLYQIIEHYRLSEDDDSVVHEISSFYKPYRVYQYSDGNINVVEKEGRPINFATIESSSSSSSSSTEIRSSSSSSSTEIRSSSSSSSTEIRSSSSSSSSLDCPNNISKITTTIRNDISFISGGALSINYNGSTSKDYYLELYDGDTVATPYDTNRIFWGEINNSTITNSIFSSLIINGTTYYVEIFRGNAGTDCCSNIIGTETSGTFSNMGFALIDVNNGILKYIPVFEKL